jgi:hypothetical protein
MLAPILHIQNQTTSDKRQQQRTTNNKQQRPNDEKKTSRRSLFDVVFASRHPKSNTSISIT